uniref:Uncharacterized protein n=1 Tax=Leersia perrieri TaxID=77586 RepID=A0A0D9WZ71_9ORYZ
MQLLDGEEEEEKHPFVNEADLEAKIVLRPFIDSMMSMMMVKDLHRLYFGPSMIDNDASFDEKPGRDKDQLRQGAGDDVMIMPALTGSRDMVNQLRWEDGNVDTMMTDKHDFDKLKICSGFGHVVDLDGQQRKYGNM